MPHPDCSTVNRDRLARYALSTGAAMLGSPVASAAVQEIEGLPLIVNVNSIQYLYLGFDGVGDIRITNDASGQRMELEDVNEYGGTLVHSVLLPNGEYMGLLGCGALVNGSLRGLGGGSVSTNDARIFDNDSPRGMVDNRVFFGLYVPENDDPGNGGSVSKHFAYLEIEIKETAPSSGMFTLTVHSGAYQDSPDTPIEAGVLSGGCFPWELFLPAITNSAANN